MKYETEINFFTQLMKNYSLCVTLTPFHTTVIPNLDFGLRETFFSEKVLFDFHHFIMDELQDSTVYYYTDAMYCKYIGFLLPKETDETRTVILIGPYTNIRITNEMLLQMMEEFHISSEYLSSLNRYYELLPLISDECFLHASVNTISECIFGGPNGYFVETRTEGISDKTELYTDAYSSPTTETMIDIHALEKIYEKENSILYIVTHGQIHKLNQLTEKSDYLLPLEKRHPDPLRDKKNYLIILNTLLRKAAEQGGVHPVYINHISGYFALKIEGQRSLAEANALPKTMIRKYCLLVHNHSTKAYSQLIQKVMIQIDIDLTADLTLNTLASALNVNASYLSTLFKKETSQTLTNYVNQKRIQHAILLLNTTTLQIQSIASYCGIPDINYFTKLFKKSTGMTPSQYRNQIR